MKEYLIMNECPINENPIMNKNPITTNENPITKEYTCRSI